MKDIDVEFEGELKINLKYQKIVTKFVTPNNTTSGKIYLPREYVAQKVIILLPKLNTKND